MNKSEKSSSDNMMHHRISRTLTVYKKYMKYVFWAYLKSVVKTMWYDF